MLARAKKLPAQFFRSKTQAEPVRDWLKSLSHDDRRIIGFDIATAEFGWPVGMPICKSLGHGLWEIRSNLPRGRIARVTFFVKAGRMVLLHGFIKKSQKSQKSDIDLSLARKKETERG